MCRGRGVEGDVQRGTCRGGGAEGDVQRGRGRDNRQLGHMVSQ